MFHLVNLHKIHWLRKFRTLISEIRTLKSKIRTWVSLLLNLWAYYISSKIQKRPDILSKSLLRKLFSSCLKLWSMWDNTCFILWIFTKFIGSEIQNSYFRNQNSEVKNQNLGEFAFESLSILYMLKDSKANSTSF